VNSRVNFCFGAFESDGGAEVSAGERVEYEANEV
jgi:hypothetical protein